jgi:hypothetical protein
LLDLARLLAAGLPGLAPGQSAAYYRAALVCRQKAAIVPDAAGSTYAQMVNHDRDDGAAPGCAGEGWVVDVAEESLVAAEEHGRSAGEGPAAAALADGVAVQAFTELPDLPPPCLSPLTAGAASPLLPLAGGRPDLPERWRAIAQALQDPRLPRAVEEQPLRADEYFPAGAPGYIRMVVSCPFHRGCYKYRNCTYSRRRGQFEPIAYLGVWVLHGRDFRGADGQRHVQYQPPDEEVLAYCDEQGWLASI